MPAEEAVHRLVEKASFSPRSEIRTGAIHLLCFRDRGQASLNAAEQALIERLAADAGEAEMAKILQLIQWLDAETAPWGFRLLERLPLKDFAERIYHAFLSALFLGESERHDREFHRKLYEVEMAELDEG